jgi:hypothetical protein
LKKSAVKTSDLRIDKNNLEKSVSYDQYYPSEGTAENFDFILSPEIRSRSDSFSPSPYGSPSVSVDLYLFLTFIYSERVVIKFERNV